MFCATGEFNQEYITDSCTAVTGHQLLIYMLPWSHSIQLCRVDPVSDREADWKTVPTNAGLAT